MEANFSRIRRLWIFDIELADISSQQATILPLRNRYQWATRL